MNNFMFNGGHASEIKEYTPCNQQTQSGPAKWGEITGNLRNQVDLVNYLTSLERITNIEEGEECGTLKITKGSETIILTLQCILDKLDSLLSLIDKLTPVVGDYVLEFEGLERDGTVSVMGTKLIPKLYTTKTFSGITMKEYCGQFTITCLIEDEIISGNLNGITIPENKVDSARDLVFTATTDGHSATATLVQNKAIIEYGYSINSITLYRRGSSGSLESISKIPQSLPSSATLYIEAIAEQWKKVNGTKTSTGVTANADSFVVKQGGQTSTITEFSEGKGVLRNISTNDTYSSKTYEITASFGESCTLTSRFAQDGKELFIKLGTDPSNTPVTSFQISEYENLIVGTPKQMEIDNTVTKIKQIFVITPSDSNLVVTCANLINPKIPVTTDIIGNYKVHYVLSESNLGGTYTITVK